MFDKTAYIDQFLLQLILYKTEKTDFNPMNEIITQKILLTTIQEQHPNCFVIKLYSESNTSN